MMMMMMMMMMILILRSNLLETPEETLMILMTVWLIVPWGWGILISS